MCSTCANSLINITDSITTQALISFCKTCGRYSRPPWVRLKPESNEMMSFLLSKVKGLKGLKLIDSNFIWTEPHSKKIKIKLTVQKEIDKILKQSSLIVDFTEEWTQCDDCKKTFTPHTWNACVQVRQKVNHKRTFLYLEQAVLKHKMHDKALNIKEKPEGVDFFFKNRSHANTFSDFVHSILPGKIKQSKQLVSHDQWSNVYNYKYTYMIEIAPLSKDDIIVLNKEQFKQLGGIGPVMLCYKISTNIHLVDPLTFEIIEFDENTYWKHNFRSYIDRECLEEFVIQNIEIEVDYKTLNNSKSVTATSIYNEVDMENNSLSNNNYSKSTNYKNTKNKVNTSSVNNAFKNKRNNHKFKIARVDCTKINCNNSSSGDGVKLYSFRTHLGDKLRIGDVALGYDLTAINNNVFECDISNFPEIVLVKKKHNRSNNKRLWKLKRMDIEKEKKIVKDKNNNEEKQYEDFLQDLEEDKEITNNVNIYIDDAAINELTSKFENISIDKKELLKKELKHYDMDIEEFMSKLKITDDNEDKKKTNTNDQEEDEYDDGIEYYDIKGNKLNNNKKTNLFDVKSGKKTFKYSDNVVDNDSIKKNEFAKPKPVLNLNKNDKEQLKSNKKVIKRYINNEFENNVNVNEDMKQQLKIKRTKNDSACVSSSGEDK